MAILASANWYIRAGGNALNGGGYDAGISGAGTNYCDQDSPQLSLTDFATSGAGVTTLSSATGGFTAAMIGNCIRIASGTNFQAGYYFVTARTDANTVTLDRTPTSGGAGSGGTGRLGGAFASLSGSLSTGGTVTAPTITSPLAAGHTINIRGGGTDTPASADYTQTGYASYPAGDTTSGLIRLVGYNGRPRVDVNDIYIYSTSLWRVENVMVKFTAAGNPSFGVFDMPNSTLLDVRVDQAGYDRRATSLVTGVFGCEMLNTGSSSAGTYGAIYCGGVQGINVVANRVSGWRGVGIDIAGPVAVVVAENIVDNCKGKGILVNLGYTSYASRISGNTVYGCTGSGISIESLVALYEAAVVNNVLAGNGAYGLTVTVGSLALNDRRARSIDYNAFYNNTSGTRNGISAGAHDITLTADPFTNAAGGDFTLNSTAGGGAALKGVAFPTSIP